MLVLKKSSNIVLVFIRSISDLTAFSKIDSIFSARMIGSISFTLKLIALGELVCYLELVCFLKLACFLELICLFVLSCLFELSCAFELSRLFELSCLFEKKAVWFLASDLEEGLRQIYF